MVKIREKKQTKKHFHFCCRLAWYDANRLLAGTNNGQICVMFNGDVQTEIDTIEGRERAATT